ncbi:MAG: hypothetical protein EHM42_06605 [Planctomycetaceae bacterium]|nr:MAG: hypothetical protein EHM42_06605 [Planctomycetaceae bacterium]
MLDALRTLDRRWIFLAMLLAVAIPLLLQKTFPEEPTPLVLAVFDKIESLPEGSLVLLSFDYAPSSDGELAPMAATLVRHCCLKRHHLVFMTLWPDGKPLIDRIIAEIILGEFADEQLQYGVDYVNLGYKPGKEVVIKTIANSFRNEFPTDDAGKELDDLPLMADVSNLQDMQLLISISAGYPGLKEWVQYAASPLGLPLAVGATAVQAPQAYPYIPSQMLGILAAVKGAAEYEVALARKYQRANNARSLEAVRRMAPQLWAHLLIIALIVLGNCLSFADRFAGKRA